MDKHFTLPPSVISMVRGETYPTGELHEVAEVGMLYYQDGKAGQAFDSCQPLVGVSARVVEYMERFLTACWELGRSDAKEGGAT